jgi:hypothetical protein
MLLFGEPSALATGAELEIWNRPDAILTRPLDAMIHAKSQKILKTGV